MNLVSDNHSTVFAEVLCKGLSVESRMVSNSVLSQSTEHWDYPCMPPGLADLDLNRAKDQYFQH